MSSVRWFLFQDEGRAVYRLDGDFKGVDECNELLDSVDELVENGICFFEMDFGKAGYLSSFGIAVLIRLKKKLVKLGKHLKLLRVGKDIRRVLIVTRTDAYLLGDEAGDGAKA